MTHNKSINFTAGLRPVTLMCALPSSSRAQVVDNFKAHTEYLALDELRGRGTGICLHNRTDPLCHCRTIQVLERARGEGAEEPFEICPHCNRIGRVSAGIHAHHRSIFHEHAMVSGTTKE